MVFSPFTPTLRYINSAQCVELAEKEERVRSVLIIQRITSEYPLNKVEFYSIQKRLRSLQLTVAAGGLARDRAAAAPPLAGLADLGPQDSAEVA